MLMKRTGRSPRPASTLQCQGHLTMAPVAAARGRREWFSRTMPSSTMCLTPGALKSVGLGSAVIRQMLTLIIRLTPIRWIIECRVTSATVREDGL